MHTPTKTLVLVSSDAGSLDEALEPFREAGFAVRAAAALESVLPQLDPAHPPAMVLLDARGDADGAALRAAGMRVLSRCALTWLAAVTPMGPGAFHQAMEGLGMLPPLPPAPTRRDGAALLAALRRFLPGGAAGSGTGRAGSA